MSKLCNTVYVKEFLFFMCVRKCNCDYYGIKTMYVLSLWNGTLFSTFVKYMLTEKKKKYRAAVNIMNLYNGL